MKIGRAVFKEDATKRLVTPQIVSLISNENFWAIDHKKYQKQSWNIIFCQIEQITVNTLILDYNGHRNILMEINHIKFYHLKELWLRQNKISNVEQLAFIQAPFLQLLRISMNYIVKFKSLIKLQSKILNEMYLPANPTLDFSIIARTRLNSELKDIFLEYWSHNNVIAEDLSFFVKINSKSFHDLWVKGEQRIPQIKLYKKLQAKYPKLNIYHKQQDEDD